MKLLFNPRWIFVITIFPLFVLSFLIFNEYDVLKAIAQETNSDGWMWVYGILGALSLCSFVYAVIQCFRRKEIDLYYIVSSLLAYTAYLVTYVVGANTFLRSDMPDWMISNHILLYTATFVMPSIIYSLFLIMVKLTDKPQDQKAFLNFMKGLLVPLVAYILVLSLSSLFEANLSNNIIFIIIIVFLIVGILTSLFFVFRAIYIVAVKKSRSKWNLYALFFPFGILFPLVGVVLNAMMGSLFGDFLSAPFFIVISCGGIVFMLPPFRNVVVRLTVFTLRCVFIVYVLYFVFVFMPFLPLGIFLSFVGFGLLILTPLIFLLICIKLMYEDLKFLRTKYSLCTLLFIGVLSAFVLPVLVTLSFLNDKEMLHETLDYFYNPNFTKEYTIDKSSVLYSLEIAEDTQGDGLYGKTPILSEYYKFLVLDNLSLSKQKIYDMRAVLSGYESWRLPPWQYPAHQETRENRNREVKIGDVKHESKYNSHKQMWESWVTIELCNKSKDAWFQEYVTQFSLPAGCWISDYYLYVGDRKEYGLLSEKKAATWIYNQIVSVRRDPGFLRYVGGNNIEFKVYPFEYSETRHTGIQFLHKEPVVINLDGIEISLGDSDFTPMQYSDILEGDRKVIYLSKEEKAVLTSIKREPYYHFIVDASKRNEGYKQSIVSDIKSVLRKNYASEENTKISIVNSNIKTINLYNGWESEIDRLLFEDGFFLDRAVKEILYESYVHPTAYFPLFVVVTENINNAVVFSNFSDFSFTYPDYPHLLWEYEGKTLAFGLSDFKYQFTLDPKVGDTLLSVPKVDSYSFDNRMFTINSVKAWPSESKPKVYLKDDNEGAIILTSLYAYEIDKKHIEDRDWNSGLTMQGAWMFQILNPDKAEQDWTELIYSSFKSRIMNPLTAYIVLETETQKQILLKKQQEVLNGKNVFDLDDETRRMSEPDLYVLMIVLFVAWVLWEKLKR